VNKIDGTKNIPTFFPAKRNVIAFGFAGCLEINQ